MSARPDPVQVACIGECMVELGQLDLMSGRAHVGFAGDTLNTAVHFAQLREGVSYLTNLETDACLALMLAVAAEEGIDFRADRSACARLPGIY